MFQYVLRGKNKDVTHRTLFPLSVSVLVAILPTGLCSESLHINSTEQLLLKHKSAEAKAAISTPLCRLLKMWKSNRICCFLDFSVQAVLYTHATHANKCILHIQMHTAFTVFPNLTHSPRCARTHRLTHIAPPNWQSCLIPLQPE